jgi:hypothetical protein
LLSASVAPEVPEDRGELEDGLSYINTDRDITLVNKGKDIYLVMVQREPDILPAEGTISYHGSVIRILGPGLTRLVAYRLEPISIMEERFWRPCMGADCTWIGPLPPPPPPIVPPGLSAMILNPQQN